MFTNYVEQIKVYYIVLFQYNMSASCPGSHLVQPPREWSRFENPCAYVLNDPSQYDANYVPFVNNKISALDVRYQEIVFRKGNVLQYKKNSSNLTKQQRYSQIARGLWTNRTKSWATQSVSFTDPNTSSLKRVNYQTTQVNNTNLTPTDSVSCPSISGLTFKSLPATSTGSAVSPVIPPPPETKTSNSPIIPTQTSAPKITSLVIPDGGNLVCNVSENFCTGQIYDTTTTVQCYPSTDSDVPGPVTLLCWNDGWPTYYPRRQYTYGSSGNKFPTNSKGIVSAVVVPYAPLNFSGVSESSAVALSWSAPAYNGGLIITSYTVVVFLNDSLVETFTGITDTSKTVTGLTSGQQYTFTVAAVNQIGTGATSSITVVVL